MADQDGTERRPRRSWNPLRLLRAVVEAVRWQLKRRRLRKRDPFLYK